MQPKKIRFFNKASLFILLITVFVSIFLFIPFVPITLGASKGFLISIGATLSLSFWIIARLGEGKIKIPKDRLIMIGAIIPLVFLISSLFSPSLYNSLLGAGFEVGTFGSMLILFIIFFLSAIHFQTEKRLWYFLGGIFISAIVLMVFELLNIFLGLGHIFPNFFKGVSSGNLIGDWNNFISFFGLIVLLLIFTLEFLKNKSKIFLFLEYLMLVLSLLFLAIVNIPLIWILVGIFSIIIFVYSISTQHTRANVVQGENNKKKFPITAFVVVFISLIFLIGSNSVGGFLAKYISIPNVDVRPTIMTTADVALKSLKHNPFLGTGPNTFSMDWSLWQPKQIAQTIFWNVDFANGFSFLQTMLVTTGVLGFLSLLFFIIILFIRGIQSLRVALQNPLSNYFIITTFIIAIYSWIMIIVSNPNIIMMVLAFTSSGMLIGILVYKKVIPVKEFSFLEDPRSSFFAILGLMILMIFSLSLTYIYSTKFISVVYFSESLNNGGTVEQLSKSENMLLSAIKLNKNDTYYRNLSQVYLNRIRILVQNKKISADNLKASLQQLMVLTEEASSGAIKQNPKQYLNYLNLGNIYSSFSALSIKGSYESAVKAYNKAKELAPNNPSIILARAQLEIINKKDNEAKKFIQEALGIKANYTAAYFLLSEINVKEKDMPGAIKQIEIAAQMSPNDSAIFYRLGILRYNNSNFKGAVSAFEQAVILKPTYLQARYFLGKSYEKVGRKNDALIQFNILNKVLPGNKNIKKVLDSISNPTSSTDLSKKNTNKNNIIIKKKIKSSKKK